eukprot:1655263-Pleurochrysis_carterae.AAC.3
MTARTVRVSDLKPFQSAAILRGYRESQKKLEKHKRAKLNAKRRKRNGMRNLTNVSETTASWTAKIRQYCGGHQYGAPLRPWRYERAA